MWTGDETVAQSVWQSNEKEHKKSPVNQYLLLQHTKQDLTIST